MTDTADATIELITLVNRVFMAADARDWTTYRSLMTNEVALDFGGVGPHPTGMSTADEVTANARRVIGPVRLTQHMVMGHVVVIDGDEATIEFYEHALHFHPELGDDVEVNTWTLYGRGTRQAHRSADGWRLSGARLDIRYQTGNSNLLADVARL